MNATKKNKIVRIGISNQGPLRVVNQLHYNPLVHTPPTGLEKHIILEPHAKIPSITMVRQHEPSGFKAVNMDGEEHEESYGQFAELGGKSIRKRRSTKRRIRKSIRKRRIRKSIRKRRKTKSKKRRTIRKRL